MATNVDWFGDGYQLGDATGWFLDTTGFGDTLVKAYDEGNPTVKAIYDVGNNMQDGFKSISEELTYANDTYKDHPVTSVMAYPGQIVRGGLNLMTFGASEDLMKKTAENILQTNPELADSLIQYSDDLRSGNKTIFTPEYLKINSEMSLACADTWYKNLESNVKDLVNQPESAITGISDFVKDKVDITESVSKSVAEGIQAGANAANKDSIEIKPGYYTAMEEQRKGEERNRQQAMKEAGAMAAEGMNAGATHVPQITGNTTAMEEQRKGEERNRQAMAGDFGSLIGDGNAHAVTLPGHYQGSGEAVVLPAEMEIDDSSLNNLIGSIRQRTDIINDKIINDRGISGWFNNDRQPVTAEHLLEGGESKGNTFHRDLFRQFQENVVNSERTQWFSESFKNLGEKVQKGAGDILHVVKDYSGKYADVTKDKTAERVAQLAGLGENVVKQDVNLGFDMGR